MRTIPTLDRETASAFNPLIQSSHAETLRWAAKFADDISVLANLSHDHDDGDSLSGTCLMMDILAAALQFEAEQGAPVTQLRGVAA